MRRLARHVLLVLSLTAGALYADLEVNLRQDKVVLTDGTEIECVIIAISQRAVMILERDPEDPEARRQRVLPRYVIKSIVRGENEGVTEGLQTEVEQARKVIAGAGFRDEEGPKAKEPKEKKDDKVAGKDGPKTEKKPGKKESTGPVGPKGPDKKDIVFTGKAEKIKTAGGVAGTIKGQPRELAEAYLQRFPALRDAAQTFMGADQLQKQFEQIQKGDAQAKAQAESFMGVFFGNDTSAVGQMMAAGGQVKSQRPERVRKPKAPPPGKQEVK